MSVSRNRLVLLGLVTLIWGVNWPMSKLALTELTVWQFRTVCLYGGAAGLLAIAWAARMPLLPARGTWGVIALAAMFYISGWHIASGFGMQLLPAGRASIIGYTMPVWTVPLSAWLLGETMTPRKLLGLALGTLGLGALVGHDLLLLGRAPAGALAMVAAALSWAMGMVTIKRFQFGLTPTVLTFWLLVVGGLPVLVGLAAEAAPWHAMSAGPAFGAIYTLLLAMVFGHWAFTRLALELPAGVLAMGTLIVPVLGVLSGMAVLGEQPGWMELAALVLVLGALAAVLLEPPRPAAPGPRAAG